MNGNSDQIRSKLSTKIVNTMLAIILVLGLSPLSKASASVANDSSQPSAAQVAQQSADDSSEGAGDSAGVGADTGADGSNVVTASGAAPATPNNQSVENVMGGGASGAVAADNAATATAPQLTNQLAAQNGSNNNAVAVQAETYNPNAEPIQISKNVTVGLFEDSDYKSPLGDKEVTSDSTLYGQVKVDFAHDERPTKEHPNVSYRFPSNIKVEPQEMDLIDNGYIVGKTVIDENGLVTLKYNENYFSGEVKDASFRFSFRMTGEPQGDGGSTAISFPGTGTTAYVKTADGDADVKKFGEDASKDYQGPTYNAEDGTYTWTIKISPKSFCTDVKVEDELGSNLSYVDGSFVMVDKGGAPTGAACSAEINGGKATIGLGNLPQGDYYLQYKTKVNSLPTEDNTPISGNSNKATVKWGSNADHSQSPSWVPDPVKAKYSMVTKVADGESTNGKIKWVVTLNTGELKADMGGYYFVDKVDSNQEFIQDAGFTVMVDGKVVRVELPGISENQLEFHLPSNIGKRQVEIVYYTKMKNSSSKDPVSNTAKIESGDSRPNGEATGTYTPKDNDTYIEKTLTSNIDSDTYDGKASWRSTIDFGAMSPTTDAGSIVFTDNPGNKPNGVKLALDGDVVVEPSEGSLAAGVDYGIVTADGPIEWGDLIKISFKDTPAVKALIGKEGATVSVSYNTLSNQVDGEYPSGTYWNKSVIKTNYVSKEAGAKYDIASSKVPQAKKSGTDAKWDPSYQWSDGSSGAWITDWKVYINGTGEPGAAVKDLCGKEVTVTDTLPEDTEVVAGSSKFKLMDKDGHNGSKEQALTPAVFGRIATFTIPTANAQYEWGELMGAQVSVTLSYQTALKASAVTLDKNKEIENKAQANTEDFSFPEGSAKSEVKSAVLLKSGNQPEKSPTVQYAIEVNPNGMDLDPNGDTLTLTDDMDPNCKFAGDLQVVDSEGNPISNLSKKFENITEGGSTHVRLTLTLPDCRHLKVAYKVTPLGELNSEVRLTNTCKLNGIGGEVPTHSGRFAVIEASSETSSTNYGISITKYDAQMSKKLKGATFALYKVTFDSAGNAQFALVCEKETNEEGIAKFGDKDDPNQLASSTLYAFKEVAAPAGYAISNSNPTYFLIKGSDASKYNEVLEESKNHGIDPRVCEGFSNRGFDVFDDVATESTGSTELNVVKQVNGGNPADNQSFDFSIEGNDDASRAKMPERVTATTTGAASVSFGKIDFSKDDIGKTYTYTIKETSQKPEDGKAWKMAGPVTATVTVGQPEAGTTVIPVTVAYTSSNAEGTAALFNNTYVIPTNASLAAKKNFEGGTLEDGQFSFKLKQTSAPEGVDFIEDRVVANNDAGNISFGEIAYEKVGTYTYKISEVVPENRANDVAYDETEHAATVEVEEGEGGQLAASVTYDGDKSEAPTFTNKKQAPAKCAASIYITKTVNGSTKLKADEDFSFQLFGADGQGMASGSQIGKTVTVKPGQKASFDEITFDKEGTYNYVIHEVKRDDGGWIAHADVPVSVTVTKDATENKLNAVVNYGEGKDAVVFDNTYQADGSAVLSVVKKVNGKELKTNRSFSFELTPVDGAPMPEGKDKLEVSTTGSEASSFDSLQFFLADAGKTYKYRIHETTVASGGWTMAGDVFALVTVGSDQGGGKLGDATVKYVKADGGQKPAEMDNGSVVFNNQYTTSTSAQIKVSKAVEGGTDAVKDEEFTFELHKANDDGAMSGDVIGGTVATKDGGTAAFEDLTYTTVDAGKTFTYWIHETRHDASCWKKDSDAKVTVEVAENDDLSLSAKVSYGDRGSDAALFTNEYIQASGEFHLELQKTVNDGAPGRSFDFKVEAIGENAGNAPEFPMGSVSSDAVTGNADFGTATLSDKDKGKGYTYKISEASALGNGWKTANPVYAFVSVSKDADADNRLGATVTYSANVDGSDSYEGPAKFNNTYDATGSAALLVKKLVNGAEPAADQSFSFAVSRDANDPASANAPLPAKTETSTTGSAPASFDSIQYTLADAGKTYKYTISETTPGTVGWTMAAPVTATVKVGEDNGDGALKPSTVEYSNASKDAALFDNKYEQASGEFQLGLVKTVNGSAPAQGQSFEFSATAEGENAANAPALKNVTTGQGGSAAFDKVVLSDKDAGKTYVYRIHEVSELKSDSGVWKPADDVIATVKVDTRGKDNKLPVTVTYSANADGSEFYEGAAKFNNMYREIGGSFQLDLAKSVEGKVLDRSFSFKAEAVGQNAESAPKLGSDAASSDVKTGKASFGAAKLTAANKGQHYTYKISETSKLSAAWAKAADVYAHVAVSEGLNSDGDLTATVTYSADEQGVNPYTGAAKFVNKYTQASGGFQLQIEKTVNGNAPAAGQSFKFKASSTDEGAPELGEMTTDETGKATFAFNGLDDSFEGREFTYTISEEFQDGNGWTKAADVKAKVAVGQRGTDNKLHPTVTYQQAGSDEWVPGLAKFNNTYEATGSAVLQVKKLVNGGADDPTGSAFTFQLKQQDGKVLSEATAKAGETVSFEPIDYTLGDAGKEFTYTISEVGGNDGAWFAAKDVTATVKVSDNKDGTLKTEVSYSNAADGQQAAALFDNAYAPASATLQVKKLVNGAEPAAGQRFEFGLSRDASDPASANAPLPEEATAATVGSAPASFGAIEFTEPGEYRYVIHETSGMGEGWTNASDVAATVKVVRDEQARTLKVESVDYGQGAFMEGGQQMALFNNKYEQPKQPDEDTPKDETPQQPDNSTPGNQPKPSADSSAFSGVKTGDSLVLVGGGVALVAIVAAVAAWFASRRKRS